MSGQGVWAPSGLAGARTHSATPRLGSSLHRAAALVQYGILSMGGVTWVRACFCRSAEAEGWLKAQRGTGVGSARRGRVGGVRGDAVPERLAESHRSPGRHIPACRPAPRRRTGLPDQPSLRNIPPAGREADASGANISGYIVSVRELLRAAPIFIMLRRHRHASSFGRGMMRLSIQGHEITLLRPLLSVSQVPLARCNGPVGAPGPHRPPRTCSATAKQQVPAERGRKSLTASPDRRRLQESSSRPSLGPIARGRWKWSSRKSSDE